MGVAQAEETITYFTSNGATHITFDSKIISKEKLSKYLEVGPAEESGFWTPNCAVFHSTNIEKFEENCIRVIDHLKSKQKDLEALKKEKGLTSILQLLKRNGNFSLYLAEVALKFFKNPTSKTLKVPFEGIDPSIHCAEEIKKIESVQDLRIKLESFTMGFSNCMNHQFRKKDHPYPLDAWNKFLKSLPISIKHVEPTEDRE